MNGAEFSPLQRECLEVLGYTRYVLAQANAAPATSTVGDAARVVVTASPSQRTPAAQRDSRDGMSPAMNSDLRDQRLLDAILRAAEHPPGALADPIAWLRGMGVPSLAKVRSDPAVKRQLWQRIRAERRPQ